MADRRERGAAEAQIVDTGERKEIAALRPADIPMSEPKAEDGYLPEERAVSYGADLAAILQPTKIVQSDVLATTDDVRTYHLEMTPQGVAVAVPDDDAAPEPVAVDGQPGDGDFRSPSVVASDTAASDAVGAEVTEERQAAAVAKTAAELRDAKWRLNLAETARRAADLEARLKA